MRLWPLFGHAARSGSSEVSRVYVQNELDEPSHVDLLVVIDRKMAGVPSTHPLRGPELRALKQLRRDWPGSPYLFISERGGAMTASNVRKLVTRAGVQAKFAFPVHPHMLRHARGFKLANEGHDTRSLQHYLGHKNIAHTVRYADMAPDRFKGFWKD